MMLLQSYNFFFNSFIWLNCLFYGSVESSSLLSLYFLHDINLSFLRKVCVFLSAVSDSFTNTFFMPQTYFLDNESICLSE